MENKKGFTLIELLLYIGLLSIIVLLITTFLFLSIEAKLKNQTMAEVEEQGKQIMQIMTQTTRNSSSINAPTIGVSGTTLSLNVADIAKTPTVFSVTSGIPSIQEGAGAPVALNSTKVTVSNFNIQNLSRPSTPGIVRISFTMTYNSSSNKQEYTFSRNFTDSASRRY